VLPTATNTAEGDGKDMITVVGSDATGVTEVAAQVAANKRVVLVTPGVRTYDPAAGTMVDLPGNYTAAAVAGLIASLAPQASPTNKVLAGVTQLVTRYSYGQLKSLLQANVCPLEDRQGIRVVRGITTEGEAFSQITTRRIVDFAKAGIRQVANPFVGRLNNERVRTALHGALDSFLTTMVVDEALTGYQLEVKATRADEIAGRCIVNVAMQPTFSIDYIRVTLALS
jgi:Phage tail sheath protein.